MDNADIKFYDEPVILTTHKVQYSARVEGNAPVPSGTLKVTVAVTFKTERSSSCSFLKSSPMTPVNSITSPKSSTINGTATHVPGFISSLTFLPLRPPFFSAERSQTAA